MKTLYKYIFWLGYGAILAQSFLSSGGNLSSHEVGHIRLDYFLHFLVYLSVCLYFAAGRYFGWELFKTYTLLKFSVVIIFLAVVSEVVQIFVPGRAFNIRDMVANISGIVVWLGVSFLVKSRAPGLTAGQSVKSVE